MAEDAILEGNIKSMLSSCFSFHLLVFSAYKFLSDHKCLRCSYQSQEWSMVIAYVS